MRFDPLRAWHRRFTWSKAETALRVVPSVLYVAMIHFVSSRESSELPAFRIDDRIAHFAEYFILGVLLMLALTAARGLETRLMLKAAWTAGIAVPLGMVDEWHQSFVPGRDSSWEDVAFDVLGAAAAALIVAWLVERKYGRKKGDGLAPEAGS